MPKEIKCPICQGTGMVKKPKTYADQVALKEKAVKILREQGWSIRAIQDFMNYRSPRAVTYLLKK